MFIQVQKLCGKFFSQVRNGYADGRMGILFESPEYLTEAMALADAKCWLAFHGKEIIMDPALEAARLAGLAAGAETDAENTVTVSSGTHVLPWEMVWDLRKPAPHPRNGAGDFGERMRARQQLFKDVAARLGITYREAQTLPSMLRANQR